MAPRKNPEANGNGDGGDGDEDKGYRLSITIDPSIRKDMRLAAAIQDMSIGEWAAKILENAADKATEGIEALRGKL